MLASSRRRFDDVVRIRNLIRLLALVLLPVAAGSAHAEESRTLDVAQIAPGNYVHYGTLEERSAANLGDNANIGFIVGEKCVAVIDTGGSRLLGEAMRNAIRNVTSVPICYVVLTHVHPDHIFGAAAFLDNQTQFVGHAQLPRALAARGRFYLNTLRRDLGEHAEGSDVVVPTLLVEDEVRLDLGSRSILVRAWPTGHTDSDLTVYDESTRTFWLSDLLFVQHTPVIDGSLTGFLEVLGQLRDIPALQFVAGHGRTAAHWPAALEPQVRYLEALLRETRAALKARKTIQDAVETVGLSEAAQWVNFDSFHRRNVTAAYTELEWED